MAKYTIEDINFQSQDREGYTIYQSGSHIRGDFIQVFVPNCPYQDSQNKRRLIVYLHGFALSLPKFYQRHLEELAQKGYYVFFPDFQKSDYPDDIESKNWQPSRNKRHLYFWYQMAIDLAFNLYHFGFWRGNRDNNRQKRRKIDFLPFLV